LMDVQMLRGFTGSLYFEREISCGYPGISLFIPELFCFFNVC